VYSWSILGGYLLASHLSTSASIPGKSLWVLWSAKGTATRLSLRRDFRLPQPNIWRFRTSRMF